MERYLKHITFILPISVQKLGKLNCKKPKSLVCPTALVPENAFSREDGWRAFRICGQLDFSLTGILAKISKKLADAGIGIFALSTYNTDYILIKEENYARALELLCSDGFDKEPLC